MLGKDIFRFRASEYDVKTMVRAKVRQVNINKDRSRVRTSVSC